MNDNKIEKKGNRSIKEKGQYFLAFGVIASLLLVAEFPVFVIFFFGVFAYFIFKIFASGSRSETRDIFEFYLSANEMLRDDGRNWFGFELKESVSKGEAIIARMSAPPPLVYFALGSLYHKIGDHQSAINCLSQVVENESANEAAYMYPSQDLQNYVKVLRKIEREPADAPLTSASIRALERARKLRAKTLLEESRTLIGNGSHVTNMIPSDNGRTQVSVQKVEDLPRRSITDNTFDGFEKSLASRNGSAEDSGTQEKTANRTRTPKEPFSDRKPITEVLHDIYDRKVQ